MRTLVVQLARFGDIYQTWPVLNALKRQSPGREIHVLVRERFAGALVGMEDVHVHVWPTARILGPIYEREDVESALAELSDVLQPLIDLQVDQVINLSFSPVSSYLTDILSATETRVSGYSRHADGYLSIPDDTSAYFYAQVGVGRSNRYHLTDLFAAVAGVDLSDDDFAIARPVVACRDGVVIHIGASRADKSYPPEMWVQVIQGLLAQLGTRLRLQLIGSPAEMALAETICQQVPRDAVVNRVGQTSIEQLLTLLSQARLLVGADSAPIHMAALTRTPALNLSCDKVSFWETGPRSAGSRVLYADEIADISPQDVAYEIISMLDGKASLRAFASRDQIGGEFILHQPLGDERDWGLVLALYTGAEYPAFEERGDLLAMQRLYELAELALTQLKQWNVSTASQAEAAHVLAEADRMITEVARLSPAVVPLVEWFETERLRLPPTDPDQTLVATRKLFEDLRLITSVYYRSRDVETVRRHVLNLSLDCAHELREYSFAPIEDRFQDLVSSVHELARHSTKIGERAWSTVLEELNLHLSKRDYIALADSLEWDLVPALHASLNECETL